MGFYRFVLRRSPWMYLAKLNHTAALATNSGNANIVSVLAAASGVSDSS
jgi:hypothetical protein